MKKSTLMVTCGQNGPVRIEGTRRRLVDGRDPNQIHPGEEPVEVPNNRYYRRLVANGSLVESGEKKSESRRAQTEPKPSKAGKEK